MLQKEGLPKENKPSMDTRRKVLERDYYECVRCGKGIMNSPYSIHHRRLRSHPFPELHEAANLITLCGSGTTGCHGWVHNHPQEAQKAGYIVRSTQNPTDIPVTYFGRSQPVYLQN